MVFNQKHSLLFNVNAALSSLVEFGHEMQIIKL